MSWLLHVFLFWIVSSREGRKAIFPGRRPDRELELLLEIVALRHQLSVSSAGFQSPIFRWGSLALAVEIPQKTGRKRKQAGVVEVSFLNSRISSFVPRSAVT